MRLIVVDGMAQCNNPNPDIILSIAEAFRRVHGAENVRFAAPGNVDAVADAYQPHLILAVSSRMWPELSLQLAVLRQRWNAVVGWWLTDDPYEMDGNFAQTKYADFVATNDRGSVPLYTGVAVFHLPLAADRERHFRPVRKNDAEYQRDVLFCGVGFPNRRAVVEAASPFLAKRKTLIVGPEWGECSFASAERVDNTALADLYNSSRIVLNLPRVFNFFNRLNFPTSTPAPRTFEASAAGGFQLAAADRPELHRYFDIPGELDLFRNTQELEEKIEWYLAHPDERMEAAQKAQTRTMNRDTYDHRVEQILEYAKTLVEKRCGTA